MLGFGAPGVQYINNNVTVFVTQHNMVCVHRVCLASGNVEEKPLDLNVTLFDNTNNK